MGKKGEVTVLKKLTKLALLSLLIVSVAGGCSSCGKDGGKWWFGKKKKEAKEVPAEEPSSIYSSTLEEKPTTPDLGQPLAPTIEAPAQETSALQMVNFDFDKYEIRPDAADVLNKNYEWLSQNPNVQVQIQGHCDERGTIEYNFNLGQKRADAVREYLIKLGVDLNRLHTISYGKERPLDPGQNEEAWAKNRRAQFLVY